MSSSATKEAKLVVKMALMFLWSYLSIFPEFLSRLIAGSSQGLLGFGHWLQLMCYTYLLTLSEYSGWVGASELGELQI